MLTMHKRVTGKTFAGANTQKETIKYLFRHSSDCFPFSAFYAFCMFAVFYFLEYNSNQANGGKGGLAEGWLALDLCLSFKFFVLAIKSMR